MSSLLEQVHAASIRRGSKADVVEFYQEKYRGKGQEGWRQRLISDLYDIRYGGVDHDKKERARLKKNLARNFDPSRLDKPGNKDVKANMHEIGESLPLKAPGGGFYITGTLRYKISSECVEREIDEEITGEDAQALVAMSEMEMRQAIINMYMEGDVNSQSSGVATTECGESELTVVPIEDDEFE